MTHDPIRDDEASPDTELPAIGRPARAALAVVGVTRLEQLPAWSERELLGLHGVGPKAVRILSEALADRSLGFRA